MAFILRELLKLATMEKLIAWTEEPVLLPRITFAVPREQLGGGPGGLSRVGCGQVGAGRGRQVHGPAPPSPEAGSGDGRMSGRPDLKVRRSEVLLGVAERIQGRRRWEPASRQELIRAGLLGVVFSWSWASIQAAGFVQGRLIACFDRGALRGGGHGLCHVSV